MGQAESIAYTDNFEERASSCLGDLVAMRRSCARFVNKVEQITAEHTRASEFSKRTELFQNLKEAARRSGLSDIPLAEGRALNSRFEALRGMYLTYYQELEYRAARRILAHDLPIESVFRSNNHSLLERELAQAKVTDESMVAFVGCGCLPWTAIAIHKSAGAQVTGFDRDPALVELGRKVIERLGYGESVRLQVAEGNSVAYGQFSHIYLAAMCDQKGVISKAIAKGVTQGGKLLIRSSRSPYQIFYPQADFSHIPEFIPVGRARCGSVDELETFIYQKA